MPIVLGNRFLQLNVSFTVMIPVVLMSVVAILRGAVITWQSKRSEEDQNIKNAQTPYRDTTIRNPQTPYRDTTIRNADSL